MKQFDLADFMQYLAKQGFDPKLGFAIASAVLGLVALLLLAVYWLRKKAAATAAPARQPGQAASPAPAARRQPATKTPVQAAAPQPKPQPEPEPQQPEPPRQTVAAAAPPAQQPKAAVAAARRPPFIPQESVLRRHYLTHVRYMAETVTFPRPTESVLRRHYEQLIGSLVDACLGDGAEMDKLLRRYDEHRKNALG